jgi:uncharacterized protein YeaO (DUF488 family)
MIKTKRVYLPPAKEDGVRILVDRLWPRGMTKEKAKLDLWLKELSPTNELRKWYSHDPKKWVEFKRRFRSELKEKKNLLKQVKAWEKSEGTVTLLFSSKEEKLNNASALREFLSR